MASEDSSRTVKGSRCAKELMSLPVVEWVCSKMSDIYGRIKNSNEIVNSVLHAMECVSDVAVKMASPLVRKLRSPLNFIDRLLCGTLCWLKNKAPMINEPPQKVFSS